MSSIIKDLGNDPVKILDKDFENTEVLALIKELLDPIAQGNSVLNEIFIEGLDASQVWSQAKLILDSTTETLLFDKIPAIKDKILSIDQESNEDSELEEEQSEQDSDEQDLSEGDEDEEEQLNENGELVDDFEESGEEDDDQEQEDEDEEQEDELDNQEQEGESEAPKKDAFGLNDEFFSIDDFNKQILEQEKNNGAGEDDEEIDYFKDIPDSDSEDEETLYYNDFFPKPGNQKGKKFDKKSSKSKKPSKEDKIEDEEDEELKEEDYDQGMKKAMFDIFEDDKPSAKNENLSSFERQQLSIQKEIQQLESESIAEKKWALKGESKSKDRPVDSLLDEDLEFERNAKPVPVITQEITESIEELIRRRIKDDEFDDLPKRVITDVTNFRPSHDFQLSETKSTKSLAELYEDDYKGVDTSSAASEELKKSHDEIKNLYQTLSHKLDSLCSAHFIPKPAQKSIDIKVNTPSISMEDAQPLTQSNANTLAPQEIFNTKRSGNENEIQLKSGTVFARDELSREDKQRLRRANKRKRSKEFQNQDPESNKKSKKQNVIDTLSKANNVTIINDKGEKRDVSGALKKDQTKQGSSMLKL
ncbi:Midasin [Wickerhamomyces ciferrii]|uniref:U3 small nucleolar ribonucleoprotein protein MPP10 n=1 Tax=Wickerhamomyces ciferrii (strain ATCC 14091 / BCRC 22168 / CBS 111 / JCM 3599 / NBRC 0793 / NRRL Y-1031 F-60-10) TaxID=1206466 RepID=K0KZQ8_WICCF|nr:Midasin [Wickerhamomyces ciferrii]CCH46814.1 Midasin [Wickerhamomyces ciferrii]